MGDIVPDFDPEKATTFGKSFRRNAEGMVVPILHPIQTAKQTIKLAAGVGQSGARAVGLKKGALSENEKLVRATGSEIIRPYSSRKGFMDTLKNDPARFLFDVGSLWLPETRLPVAGRVARTVNRAADPARFLTNPVMTAGTVLKHTGKGARAAHIKAKGGIYNPRTGQWSQTALNAVRDATDGRVGVADLQADPAFAERLIATMRQKGVNQTAVKQAILAHHGAPTPRSRITGKPAHIDAAAASAEAAKAGRQAIAGRVGTSAPSTTDLGRALDEAVTDSHNNVNHLYARATSGPEQFKPAAESILVSEMDKALDSAGFKDFRDLPSAKGAREADKFVRGKLYTLARNDALTPAAIESIRQELNILWSGSRSPTDRNILNTMKEGLDKGMEEAAGNGFLAAGSPSTFLGDLRNARAAHQQHKLTFEQSGPIGTAVRALEKTPQGPNGLFVPSGDDGLYTKAQNTLVKGIVGDKGNVQPGGLLLFDRLEKDILAADPTPLHDVLKETVGHFDTNADKGATFKVTPGNTQRFVDSPVGQNLYAPDEAAAINLGAEGRRILDAKPPSAVQNASAIRNAVDATKGALGRALTGAAAGSAVGSPGTGAFLNWALGAAKQGSRSKRAVAQELGGAPNAFPIANAAEKLGTGLEAVSRPVGFQHFVQMGAEPEQEQPQPTPVTVPPPAAATPAPISASEDDWDSFSKPVAAASEDDWDSFSHPVEPEERPARASGGRTGQSIEHLVTALMNRTKHAKRVSNAVTKPLLGVHDDAIANALAVAQKAI